MSNPDEQEASSSQADGAQGVPPPHSAELRGKVANPPLCELHGHSVAVRLPSPSGEQILLGSAAYAFDRDLGQVLRIVIGTGGLEIVLAEAVFQGQILRGEAYRCEFLIDVTAKSPVAGPAAPLPKQ